MKFVDLIPHPENQSELDDEIVKKLEKMIVKFEEAFDTEPFLCSLVICEDNVVRQLNLKFRAQDKSTDVLSFTADEHDESDPEPYIGDIFVNLDMCKERAKRYSTDLLEEIVMLLAHGLCHLKGYDHFDDGSKALMGAEEERLLKVLGLESLLLDTSRKDDF